MKETKKRRFIENIAENKLMLPPLSGYTDYPFRRIMAMFRPPFILTEMAKARAIVEKNEKTLRRFTRIPGSHMEGVQLLGSDPSVMAEAAKAAEELGFDFVDINMGCTVRKVASKGEGISLMKNDDLAEDIVRAVAGAAEIPVTAKLRLGATKESLNVIPLARRLVDAGASAITIHARTGEKKYSGVVHTEMLKEAVEALPVPVIANGGIFSGENAKRMLAETGAAGVMPGRGILGNPWLIQEILCALEGRTYADPSLEERKKVCLEHFELLSEFYGQKSAAFKIRKILPWYFPACRNLKALRMDAQQVKNSHEVPVILDSIKEGPGGPLYDAPG